MRYKAQILVIVVSLLGLQSCATLSKEECRAADWRTIGFSDGARGYASGRISDHREACAEYGVAPNLQQYLAGHKEGIRNYCVPNQGFDLGRRGTQYNGICPADLEPAFLSSYRQGQEIYVIERDIKQFERERNDLISEHDSLLKEIEDNERIIVSDNTSPQLRRELLEQNRRLEQLVEEKDFEINQYERQIERLERKVNALLGGY
ncbi:MAG: DUF2799 domain-containing protein [Gammaproteobacteria bacterium]|nr:DUF2799 domain-containing protein [Gammaproteobacteria bacterium]